MKVGSLFTGYGGLDIAVGGDLAWYSEIDKPACKVLQTHYPNVPNLGDITKIDWAQVEPVDVITGGYPCQPFSHAGLRKGKNDERHLWPYVRDAIDALRPRYAILENVSGHLTLGFGDVLADLATIGFNAEWGIIRASDVGAPHGRKRLFIVAYADSQGLQGSPSGSGEAQTERHGHAEQGVGAFTTNPSGNGHGIELHAPRMGSMEGETTRSSQQRQRTRGKSDSRGVVVAADTVGEHGQLAAGRLHSELTHGNRGQRNAANTDNRHGQTVRPVQGFRSRHAARSDMPELQPINWGKYQPAIERWEAVIDRSAPAPTVQHKGKARLNPQFVEWMMGLDEGHVTGHGLSSAQELKMLGNGVVPQQARAAINQLLERITP